VDDASLSRRRTIGVSASASYARVRVIGINAQINSQSLRLKGLAQADQAIPTVRPIHPKRQYQGTHQAEATERQHRHDRSAQVDRHHQRRWRREERYAAAGVEQPHRSSELRRAESIGNEDR
jgi:hypothetical protein